MAHMIPAVIPEQTLSNAEKHLFAVLKERLDYGFTVFHSFNLLTRNRQQRFIEGEIDFLIFSPAHGFLVLEVKGGIIEYEGSTDRWFQNDKLMNQSPFRQARDSKHKLRDFLFNQLGHKPKGTFAYAVCFPEVFDDMKNLPSGAESRICITGAELPLIDKKVQEIFESFSHDIPESLESDESERIRQILMPHCEYGTSLKDRMGRAERDFFRLTEEQCRMLDTLSRQKRVLIEGCAGSGKTVMAVKKARELAAEGKSVLILCYNVLIGERLASEVGDLDSVTACNYHKFCEDLLKKAGRFPADEGDSAEYWKAILPEALESFLQENPVKYDAVIVDEGQDFYAEWWVTVDDLVKPDGYFYIFYDPGQNLWGTGMDFPIKGEPYTFYRNCRNTREIFNMLQHCVSMEMSLMGGAPVGDKVIDFSSPDAHARRERLAGILHELMAKGIDRSRIVILGGHSVENTCIGSDPAVGGIRITQDIEDESDAIHYYTYMKFKGCEADVVILLDVDRNDERWNDTALYTAISRAKYLLYIIWAS